MPVSMRESHKWGIDTWILMAFPIEKVPLMLQEQGFESFEYAYEHFREDDAKGTMASRVKSLSDAVSTLKIEPSQMHAPYGDLEVQIASPHEAIRMKAIEKAKEWLSYASSLGVKSLVFHTGWIRKGDDLSTGEQVARCSNVNKEVFTQVGRLGAQTGVKVAVENRLEGGFGSKPRDLLDITSNDPDNLGVCLDTGHANVNGISSGQFIRELGDRLIATHIHDNDGRSDLHLLPYMGNIDWSDFFLGIEDIAYRGALILEVPGYESDEALCLNRMKLARWLLSSLSSI